MLLLRNQSVSRSSAQWRRVFGTRKSKSVRPFILLTGIGYYEHVFRLGDAIRPQRVRRPYPASLSGIMMVKAIWQPNTKHQIKATILGLPRPRRLRIRDTKVISIAAPKKPR
jgi:hypothetical protein